MKYYRIVENGYIQCVGTGCGGEEITEEEYNAVVSAIESAPKSTDTIGYRLKTNLTWEEYEIQPDPPVPDEPTAEELLNILTGEAE